jgi:FtsZ-binding cell division protein ZapB
MKAHLSSLSQVGSAAAPLESVLGNIQQNIVTLQMEVENLKTHVKVSGSRLGGMVADSSALDDLRREIEAIRRDASEAKRTANRTADKLRRPAGVDGEGTAVGIEHSSVITRLTEDVAALKAASQGTLDIGQLTHDVRCLKYENRRLKDQATVGGSRFMTASDGSGLDELVATSRTCIVV